MKQLVISNVGHGNLVHGNMFEGRMRLHCNHTSCGILQKKKKKKKKKHVSRNCNNVKVVYVNYQNKGCMYYIINGTSPSEAPPLYMGPYVNNF